MKMLMIAAATIAAIGSSVANAGPLPEAKPDDVGFSQQGLARLDDFFGRRVLVPRHLQHPERHRRQRRQLLKLLQDQLDAFLPDLIRHSRRCPLLGVMR